MTSKTLAHQVELSLFAALIYISVAFLRIPVGPQFVHIGNALVVVALLLYGAKEAALVATIGLGIFDILNGYASVVWITVLESLMVCLVLHFVYEKWLKSLDNPKNVITVALVAAVLKLVMIVIKYTLFATIGGNLPLHLALATAFTKVGGSFGTAIVTVIAVPLLYPLLKPLSFSRTKSARVS
ncbi:ECF transporter S component [Streptococcus ictaluri]|uniref:Uncharacterized protein n=1 Tax=Streptococcus ictaluri 707-05 TaxID=764299 RepID=G5K301_9STRE|nr:ECF transporter S component [Streptococcus ictaluri]EHI69683.1 hypothetical protein STRIC_1169 [Streptococcus ictaluri 707-05]